MHKRKEQRKQGRDQERESLFILSEEPSLKYSFNETCHTSECWVQSNDKPFLFSAFSGRHYFGLWRLHSLINERPLTSFRSFKKITFLFSLVVSSSIPNMVEGSSSPLTHTRLIGSEVLPCPHLLVIIERVKERYSLRSPYSVILIYNYRSLTVKCIRMSYFLITICIPNNSIKNQSSVYTQLNDRTVMNQTIQLSKSQQN